MPTFVTLMSYTQQGIENIKESPSRIDGARELANSLGIEIREFYLAMGRYDAVILVDAPDAETLAKFALASASLGNIRTETLRLFSEAEFRKMASELP